MIEFNYLTMLRKSDFVDLFKYGHIFVQQAVVFDGDFSLHAQDRELFEQVTYQLNDFDYSIEYLILHHTSSAYQRAPFCLNIEQVQNVYALDQMASSQLKMSLDSRIVINVSPWEDFFVDLEEKRWWRQAQKGIDILWHKFQLDPALQTECQKLFPETDALTLYRHKKRGGTLVGDHSALVYLTCYGRHDFYPQKARGFFCDLVHSYTNFHKEGEQLQAWQPELLTSNLKNEPDFKNVLNDFKKGVEPICKDMIQQCPNYHHYITGPLFFQLKKLAEEKILLGDSIVEYVLELHKEYGGLDVPLAIYLLGIILGRENLYDSYYDDCKLPCFQKHEPTLPSEEPAEDATTSPAEPTLPSEESAEDATTSSAEPTLPSEESAEGATTSPAKPTPSSEESVAEDATTSPAELAPSSKDPVTDDVTTPPAELAPSSKEPVTDDVTTPSAESTPPSKEPVTDDVTTSSAEPTLPSKEPAEDATTSSAEPALPSEEPAKGATTSPAEPVLPAEGGAADVTTSPNNRKKNTGSSRSKKAKTKLEEKDLFQNNISN